MLEGRVMYVIVAGWEWPIMWARVPACVQQPLIGSLNAKIKSNEESTTITI